MLALLAPVSEGSQSSWDGTWGRSQRPNLLQVWRAQSRAWLKKRLRRATAGHGERSRAPRGFAEPHGTIPGAHTTIPKLLLGPVCDVPTPASACKSPSGAAAPPMPRVRGPCSPPRAQPGPFPFFPLLPSRPGPAAPLSPSLVLSPRLIDPLFCFLIKSLSASDAPLINSQPYLAQEPPETFLCRHHRI